MLIYSPVTLNTVYKIASPKCNSPAWTPPLISWLILTTDSLTSLFGDFIGISNLRFKTSKWTFESDWYYLPAPLIFPFSVSGNYLSIYSRNNFSSHFWILLLISYIWFDLKNVIDFSNKPWILPLTTSRPKHLYLLLILTQNIYNIYIISFLLILACSNLFLTKQSE